MRPRRRTLELNSCVARARVDFLRVAGVVSAATGVSVAEIVKRQGSGRPYRWRSDPVSFARLTTTYLTVTACNVRQGTLARTVARHRCRILFDIRFVEDAREDPATDKLLERMEAML